MDGGESACRKREGPRKEAGLLIWEENHHECQHNAVLGARIRNEDAFCVLEDGWMDVR